MCRLVRGNPCHTWTHLRLPRVSKSTVHIKHPPWQVNWLSLRNNTYTCIMHVSYNTHDGYLLL
jgi:hypothetical protein